MYPYSNVPPTDNSNQPGAYPPPPYQQPNFYQPHPQTFQHFNPVWRVIGIIALVWFVAAVVFGHHLFWPIIIIAAFIFFARSHRWGGYRWQYGRHHRHHRHYRYDNAPYYYYPNQGQPGYYPPQSSQPPYGSAAWPSPTDESNKDANL